MDIVRCCPRCGEVQPPLTLRLEDPGKYQDETSIPDNRVYGLICLACGETINTFTIDNTITALKALRDEMDALYGQSRIIPYV